MTPPLVAAVRTIILRDLESVGKEIAAYPSDGAVWELREGISNSGGTLALHIAGNLSHYFGTRLAGTGYVRHRDLEFSARDVSRSEIRFRLDAARQAVEEAFARLSDATIAAEYPEPIAGHRVSTGDFIVHLAAHLAYHLGQIDYHRRLVSGGGALPGVLSPAALAGYEPG